MLIPNWFYALRFDVFGGSLETKPASGAVNLKPYKAIPLSSSPDRARK